MFYSEICELQRELDDLKQEHRRTNERNEEYRDELRNAEEINAKLAINYEKVTAESERYVIQWSPPLFPNLGKYIAYTIVRNFDILE